MRLTQGPLRPISMRMNSGRMAGEEIPAGLDALIAGIKDEAKEERLELAVQDARAYMDRQLGIEDQFQSAGLTPDQARAVEDLVEISGRGVPTAFIHSPSVGVEQRVHTRYGTNPVTGTQEIVPYLNKGTGEVLVTNYGDSRTSDIDLGGYYKASEYVQDRAMRLMGTDPQRNNSKRVTDVDFIVDGSGVDGEIREGFEASQGNIPVQLYTLTTTPDTKGMDKRTVASAVDNVIRGELRKRGGNPIEATERAYKDGSLRDAVPGKLSKTKEIPRLLMTTLDSESAIRNKNAKDKISIAPQEVRVVNMGAAREYVENMSPEQALHGYGRQSVLQVRPNDGDPSSRNREGRGRVYVRVPQNAPGVSYDAAERFPEVAQLY